MTLFLSPYHHTMLALNNLRIVLCKGEPPAANQANFRVALKQTSSLKSGLMQESIGLYKSPLHSPDSALAVPAKVIS